MSDALNSKADPDKSTVYQIRVKGHLDPQWSDWFGGLTVTLDDNGDMLLTGPVIDQAALHGLLRKVRDLGMLLVSVSPVETGQTELPTLQSFSTLLPEVPVPENTSTERYGAQGNMRSPRSLSEGTKSPIQEVGWWLIPVGLLVVWVFISTTRLVHNAVSTANELGLLNSIPTWLMSGSSKGAYWSDTLGEFGLLRGSNLGWVEMTEAFTRNMLPQIVWQGSIALLYLAWYAIWWARHTTRAQGRLLVG